jgi:hypothetical protein
MLVAPASAALTTSRAVTRRGELGSTITACTWWLLISAATSASGAWGGQVITEGHDRTDLDGREARASPWRTWLESRSRTATLHQQSARIGCESSRE